MTCQSFCSAFNFFFTQRVVGVEAPDRSRPSTEICILHFNSLLLARGTTSGQSYKASTIVIYDSRVVPNLKIPILRL